MSKKQAVAVVGATGAVGQQLLKILAERNFPISQLIPFASPRSVGKSLEFSGKNYVCQALTPDVFLV